MNEVYYRLYVGRDGKVIVVCMQDFDECDYNQSRFITDDKFETEEDAITYLNTNVKPDKIAEEYKTFNKRDYFL